MIATPMENIAAIHFPSPFHSSDDVAGRAVLDAVASCCAEQLRKGGYFSEEEADDMLDAYRFSLRSITTASRPSQDFLIFTAEQQARKHSLTIEGELHRMQMLLLLRWSLSDRVHCWTFGMLPGRAGSLYDHRPSLRDCCALLGCPAVLAGETSIIHVASVNPVAVLAAAAWIGTELTTGGGDTPFVFPFMIDLPLWHTLRQRHFEP